jgi:hypothetical protein
MAERQFDADVENQRKEQIGGARHWHGATAETPDVAHHGDDRGQYLQALNRARQSYLRSDLTPSPTGVILESAEI